MHPPASGQASYELPCIAAHTGAGLASYSVTVHKVELSYSLGGGRSPDSLIRNPLMDLLTAVREQGSISGAAKALQLSYRHVWGELKRWEQALGHSLIIWDKGQPARLTEFGDKLLWAERQAQAGLAPQIQALHADLERAFAMAFDDSLHVLTFYASHDDALAQLREHAAASAKLHLDIRFTGSVDAISALNEGRCVMAGFHVRENPAPGSLAERTYKPLLQPGLHKIIGFAQRSQGLIVARGNPLGIDSLQALQRTRARYANRPPLRWPVAARMQAWAWRRLHTHATSASCRWCGRTTTWCASSRRWNSRQRWRCCRCLPAPHGRRSWQGWRVTRLRAAVKSWPCTRCCRGGVSGARKPQQAEHSGCAGAEADKAFVAPRQREAPELRALHARPRGE